MTRNLRPRKARPNYTIEEASDKEADDQEGYTSSASTNSSSTGENSEDAASVIQANNKVAVTAKVQASKPATKINTQGKGLSGYDNHISDCRRNKCI